MLKAIIKRILQEFCLHTILAMIFTLLELQKDWTILYFGLLPMGEYWQARSSITHEFANGYFFTIMGLILYRNAFAYRRLHIFLKIVLGGASFLLTSVLYFLLFWGIDFNDFVTQMNFAVLFCTGLFSYFIMKKLELIADYK